MQFCPVGEEEALLARMEGIRPLREAQVAAIIRRLQSDALAWSQGPDDSAFSLGGAQAKTALRFENGRWSLPFGKSPTTHILKPGASILPDSDLIEHLCQRTATLQIPIALQQAIDELSPEDRYSHHLGYLVEDIRNRAAKCRTVGELMSPVTPLSGQRTILPPPIRRKQVQSSLLRPRCSHIGVRSGKRCLLASGHTSPHRYKRR